ncbi:hypothetical protein [Kitasatospora sp. NPDC088779]|uniref:hypothetical protein n=1 Tax=Kitasatospora sp. NPDC088779 TaxID=3154964 RepID=UPI00341EE10A
MRDTVVLPLAGAGSRLGLPIAKELVPVGPGRVALDHTLDLLAPHAGRLRVAAVLGDGREATARHLVARCEHLGLPLAVCHQHPDRAESTGAVSSTSGWWSPATAVLLPDQILTHPDPAAIGALLDAIRVGHPAAFLTADESDPARLAVDGALRLEPDPAGGRKVADFADKPGPQATGARGFNAVWFGYAFAVAAGDAVLDVLHRATLGEDLARTDLGPLLGAPAIDAGPFTDIGTWPAVAATIAGAGVR